VLLNVVVVALNSADEPTKAIVPPDENPVPLITIV